MRFLRFLHGNYSDFVALHLRKLENITQHLLNKFKLSYLKERRHDILSYFLGKIDANETDLVNKTNNIYKAS